MNREQRGLGQRVQNDVQNQTGLRCDRRGVLGEHADDDGRQNRYVEEAEAGLQEVIQTGRSQADSRRNANGNDCEHDAEALANTHQMFVRSVRVEQRAMQHLAAAAFPLSDSRITARHFPSGIFRIWQRPVSCRLRRRMIC